MAIPVGEPRPSPLAVMTVLVADEKVHESRLEKGSGIDAVAGAVFEVVPQLVGSAHLPGIGKAGGIVRAFGRMLLQQSYQARKGSAVLAEPGIIRNHYERVPRMEDAGGFHQRIDHEGSRWAASR